MPSSIIPGKNAAAPASGDILIIDDEECVRETVSAMLKMLGYTPVCVKDGDEAIVQFERKRASGKRFDAILCDLTIPGGMDGKEIISVIRQTDAHTPIIASSGYSEDPVLADPRQFGFTAGISKPFTFVELHSTLQSVLRK